MLGSQKILLFYLPHISNLSNYTKMQIEESQSKDIHELE